MDWKWKRRRIQNANHTEGAAVVWRGYEGFLYHLGAGGPSYLGDRDKERGLMHQSGKAGPG